MVVMIWSFHCDLLKEKGPKWSFVHTSRIIFEPIVFWPEFRQVNQLQKAIINGLVKFHCHGCIELFIKDARKSLTLELEELIHEKSHQDLDFELMGPSTWVDEISN